MTLTNRPWHTWFQQAVEIYLEHRPAAAQGKHVLAYFHETLAQLHDEARGLTPDDMHDALAVAGNSVSMLSIAMLPMIGWLKSELEDYQDDPDNADYVDEVEAMLASLNLLGSILNGDDTPTHPH